MKTARFMPLVLVAAALCAARPALAAGPLKVAIANPSRIFNEMQETKDLKEKLEARRKELQASEQDKRAKIEKLQQDRSNTKPDHPQYKDLSDQLDQAMADFETWGKVTRLQAEREQKETMKRLFDKIEAAIAVVAKQQGIDLVIADERQEIGNLEQLNFEQLRALLNQRDVLYASKEADMSEAVLTELDAAYVKEKAAGSPALLPK